MDRDGIRWRPDATTVVVVLAAVVAASFALVHTARRDWMPVGDEALMYLRAMDVGSAHTPLVGPYSRFGWYHPGPSMYFLFAAAIRALAGSPSGLLVATLVCSLSSAACIVGLAARRAGMTAALVLASFTAILCLGLGDWLIDPWNPYFDVMPFAAFLVAAWFAADGDVVAARIACVAGSVAAQAHLGAVPPVALIGGAAIVLAFLRRPHGLDLRNSAWNAALLGLLWALPAVEEVSSHRGNLTNIVRFFATTEKEPIVGWLSGVRMSAYLLLPWGPWTGRAVWGLIGNVPPAPAWQVAMMFALLAGGAALALRARDVSMLRLMALLAVATGACVVAAAEVRGVPFFYLFLWTRPVAMMLAAAPLLVLARWKEPVLARWRGAPSAPAVTALVVAVVSVRAWRADIPLPFWSRLHANLSAVALRGSPRTGDVRVVLDGPAYTGSPEAIAVAFEAAGRSAKLTPFSIAGVGEPRTVEGKVRLPTLLLAIGMGIERVPYVDRAQLLYWNDPLTQRDRQEARGLRRKLEAELVLLRRTELMTSLDNAEGWFWWQAPPGLDKDALARYLRLASGTDKLPIALYSLPAVTW
jgi:hypothetical protein